ncbi:MAG: DedA family protein [Opitutaceae bacterium]|jgi:membrane protein DedA with SNARE-associated domain|nr:DedA family protein [Opitutaceae bacterium]
MFETLLKYFEGSPLSLWGPFLILILCGLGLPVPEDIVLVAAGALGEIDGRTWMEVSALMYVGVMLGDSTIFFAGRFFGTRLRSSRWFQRYFSEKKQGKVEDLFDRYHSWVLFVGRFLPGLRAPIFFTAGSTRVKFLKFFFFDGLAALVSVPFFVWLGHWLWRRFKDDIAQLDRVLSRTQSYTMLVGLLLGSVLVLIMMIQFRRMRARKDSDWENS